VKGKKRHDFDVSFRKSVKALQKLRMNPSDCVIEIETMLEMYYRETGEYPSNAILEAMADAILAEDLKNKSVDKVSAAEYPILSESQLNRRINGNNIGRRRGKRHEVHYDDERASRLLNEIPTASLYLEPIKETPEKKLRREVDKETEYYTKLNEQAPITVFYVEPTPVERVKSFRGRGEIARQWALSVKERDGYQCQNPRCKSRVGIMHAHHINSYIDHPEDRYDLNNGITLCEQCHTEFHAIYGKGRNNLHQLREYFGL
jgi:5-methylcytosine-specific restriction endonuclease McrA